MKIKYFKYIHTDGDWWGFAYGDDELKVKRNDGDREIFPEWTFEEGKFSEELEWVGAEVAPTSEHLRIRDFLASAPAAGKMHKFAIAEI